MHFGREHVHRLDLSVFGVHHPSARTHPIFITIEGFKLVRWGVPHPRVFLTTSVLKVVWFGKATLNNNKARLGLSLVGEEGAVFQNKLRVLLEEDSQRLACR